ncbi:hypothetical protein AA313_de0200965 [Arthrobotrys entomopaga]|nr:hypothetical protein AA313_de0200965 [Arthrobotrys entomopaga]
MKPRKQEKNKGASRQDLQSIKPPLFVFFFPLLLPSFCLPGTCTPLSPPTSCTSPASPSPTTVDPSSAISWPHKSPIRTDSLVQQLLPVDTLDGIERLFPGRVLCQRVSLHVTRSPVQIEM